MSTKTKDRLSGEYEWLIGEMMNELSNVRLLCESMASESNESWTKLVMPPFVKQLVGYHGLEQRIKVPMQKLVYLYPTLVQSNACYNLREAYKHTIELITK